MDYPQKIKEYWKVNQVEAKKFEELLKKNY